MNGDGILSGVWGTSATDIFCLLLLSVLRLAVLGVDRRFFLLVGVCFFNFCWWDRVGLVPDAFVFLWWVCIYF